MKNRSNYPEICKETVNYLFERHLFEWQPTQREYCVKFE